MKKTLIILASLLLWSANLGAVHYDSGGNNQNSHEPMYVEGVLIINFAPQVNIDGFSLSRGNITTGIFKVDNVFMENGVDKLEKMFPGSKKPDNNLGGIDLSNYCRIEFPAEKNVLTLKEQLEELSGIEKVELVGIHQIDVVPNDAFYGSQWFHSTGSDHDIDSPEAWNVESGDSAVIVAIVDTGVLWNHPDLGGAAPFTNGNIWINWSEFNGVAGVDDDGNGYIDDFHGWDWVSVSGAWSGEDESGPDNDPTDFNGHGTHCAGIVAAITNNGSGVAGVAGGFYPSERGVKIMPLRVGWSAPHPTQGYETGYVRMDFCAQAFYYAVQNGADIISCSWGSSNSGGISAAMSYALNNNIVICKAAGNDDNQIADYLCQQNEVISVASTTSGDTKSSFSSYGSWVDISAPGSSIYSTYSNHGSATYASLSGTSMATPMTAGVCALIKSRDLNLGREDIFSILINSSDNIDALNPGYAGLMGAGRINSYNAVTQLLFSDFQGTPRMGRPPLTVDFAGSSPFTVDTWKYYFGDGDSSDVQNPEHTYTEAGAYTVRLDIATSQGQASTSVDSFIYVLADTLQPDNFEGDLQTTDIEIPIRLSNIIPVDQIILPITYAGPLDLVYDSFTVAGTRCDYFEKAQLIGISLLRKVLAVRLQANIGGGSLPLGAGNGAILRLFFHIGTPHEGTTIIDTATFNQYVLDFSTFLGDYIPEYLPSEINISNGLRGDANGDDLLNVSDAVHIINYVFIEGQVPASQCGGDANSDNLVNVSDAVYIINYIFMAGSPAPLPCF